MSDAREKRRQAIFDAAYDVMTEKGYKGTSMLAVAKAAGASNETMYNWFGNKQGLFAAMVEDNAERASGLLRETLQAGGDALQTLETFGAELLQLLNGKRAIALNRAAAADVAQGGVLGELLADNGRRKVVPLVANIFRKAVAAGQLRENDPDEMAEIYIALLLGDIQIRRVIGVTAAPSAEATQIHSHRVMELITQLFGPEG